MKIVQRVQEIWSRHESVTDGQADGRSYSLIPVLVLTVLEKIAKKA